MPPPSPPKKRVPEEETEELRTYCGRPFSDNLYSPLKLTLFVLPSTSLNLIFLNASSLNEKKKKKHNDTKYMNIALVSLLLTVIGYFLNVVISIE